MDLPGLMARVQMAERNQGIGKVNSSSTTMCPVKSSCFHFFHASFHQWASRHLSSQRKILLTPTQSLRQQNLQPARRDRALLIWGCSGLICSSSGEKGLKSTQWENLRKTRGDRRCWGGDDVHIGSLRRPRESVCSTVWCKSKSSSVKVQVPIIVQPQLWGTHLNPLVKDQLKSPLVFSMYLVWAALAWWNWERGRSYSKIAWWAMDCPILGCWVERVPINGWSVPYPRRW